MANATIADKNLRPTPDKEFVTIADYVVNYTISSPLAYSTARYCLMDALGCAYLALQYPECTKLLGPIVPGTVVPQGVPIPGTHYVLDPIQAAFNIGVLIRWLDYNDTWLAAEWGHPSDNLGAILAVADYVSRQNILKNQLPLTIHHVLTAMIKTYEIQGILALENSFNRIGLDHVALVKIASAAVIMHLLSGKLEDVINVLSHAFIDGQSLRTYRHAPNTGPRKSWAAGDATRRAVELAWIVMQGQIGYPSGLTAKQWGFYDVLFRQKTLKIPRSLDSYVMENILFKISYPAEFHAQTALECAIILHDQIKDRLNDIKKIVIKTQESAIRIISKTGPLYNPADRDHCLQYMVAIGLIFGDLNANHYENTIANDPRIDILREKMVVQEDPLFTQDYLDPQKRSIANAIEIYFNDDSHSHKIQIDYPIGHRKRREQGLPLLINKFKHNLSYQLSQTQAEEITDLFLNQEKLEKMPVNEFMEIFNANPG